MKIEVELSFEGVIELLKKLDEALQKADSNELRSPVLFELQTIRAMNSKRGSLEEQCMMYTIQKVQEKYAAAFLKKEIKLSIEQKVN